VKRMHVHVAVDDLGRSIGFYSALFDAQPAVVKPDYAKWTLDDPRVNFAISTRGREPGLDHLGIQVETRRNYRRFMLACVRLAALSSSRVKLPVAMPSRRNRGSMIRPVLRGRPSIRLVRIPTMATAQASVGSA